MPNTPRWGKLVSTRPSALLYCFAEAYPAEDRRFFQALLLLSPVSGGSTGTAIQWTRMIQVIQMIQMIQVLQVLQVLQILLANSHESMDKAQEVC